MIKLTLPFVKATGRRAGWWFHVQALDRSKRGPGLRQFDGTQLAAGECELPVMAVVLLLRPTGTAKSDTRVADVMYVDPVTRSLQGWAYGLPWGNKAGDPELCEQVSKLLASRDTYEDTERRIKEATADLVGTPNTAESRRKVAAEISAIIQQVLPPAREIAITTAPCGDALSVSFKVGATRDGELVRCAVPTYNGAGDPDFYFLFVEVPKGYVNVDEDPESDEPHHHAAARKAAVRQGYDSVTDNTPVYDDLEGRWSSILDMFEWGTALVHDMKGEPR
jgi:hypothetical protein